MASGRICQRCKAPLIRRQDERNAKFEKRKYCSHRCSAAGAARMQKPRPDTIPPRRCAGCGRLLVRKEGECSFNWRRRKACDRRCAGKVSAGRLRKTASEANRKRKSARSVRDILAIVKPDQRIGGTVVDACRGCGYIRAGICSLVTIPELWWRKPQGCRFKEWSREIAQLKTWVFQE